MVMILIFFPTLFGSSRTVYDCFCSPFKIDATGEGAMFLGESSDFSPTYFGKRTTGSTARPPSSAVMVDVKVKIWREYGIRDG